MPVRIFAINETGHESGFGALDASLTLPWLQDTSEVNAWENWAITYRDVVVLGPDNERLSVYNLTEHDLAIPTNYATLKETLKQASADAASKP